MNYLQLTKTKLEGFLSRKTTNSNISEKNSLMRELKILMLQFNSLPPSNSPPILGEFELAISIIEAEMEFSLEKRDEKAFELAYLKAKQYYFDYSSFIPTLKTNKMLYFIGLYLLHLLSNHRATDFSNEIELIDKKDLSCEYIKISRNLEQGIMEGNYKQLEKMKQSTDQFYSYYLGKFDDTVRYQIARSAEKAYDSIKFNDAISLLMLNNENELKNFVNLQNQPREDREIDWKIENNRIIFLPLNKEKENIPSYRIINDAIHLGIELEKII